MLSHENISNIMLEISDTCHVLSCMTRVYLYIISAADTSSTAVYHCVCVCVYMCA